MGRASLGQAKNVIRRALRAILDREPSDKEKALVWEYFKSECVYCGQLLTKGDRKAHLDHLVHQGSNHISNRVLSCGICNGDEKREQDWQEFLNNKVADKETFNTRKKAIEDWISKTKTNYSPHDKATIVDEEIAKVMEVIDKAAERLRAHRIPPGKHSSD